MKQRTFSIGEPTDQEKIFTNPTSDRGLISKIYNQLKNLDSKINSEIPIKEQGTEMVIPPEDLLLLKIILAILGFLFFHMKLRIALSMSVKNYVGILMGIALNLQIAFGKMVIITMLILSIHEHGRSFHLPRFLITFFRDLYFLLHRSFTCLVRVTPRYCILFCGYCEGCCFFNYILSLFIFCVKEVY